MINIVILHVNNVTITAYPFQQINIISCVRENNSRSETVRYVFNLIKNYKVYLLMCDSG